MSTSGSFLVSAEGIHAENVQSLICAGLLWLTLTVLFELGCGHFVFGRSWESLGSDFDDLHGGLLPFGLLVLTLFSADCNTVAWSQRQRNPGRDRALRGVSGTVARAVARPRARAAAGQAVATI